MDQIRKLVSRRLRAQVPGEHPEPDLVTALVENALSQSERSRLLDHLAACSDCREVFYLAMPDLAEAQKVLSLPARPGRKFVAGWGVLIASLSIVAVVASNAIHERPVNLAARMESKSPAAFAGSAQIAERSAAAVSASGPAQQSVSTAPSKRPALKHMTAKPRTAMEFDKLSGEVHLQPQPGAQATASPLQPARATQPPIGAPAVNADQAKRLGEQAKAVAGFSRSPAAIAEDQAPKVLSVETAQSQNVNLVSASGVITPTSPFRWTLSPEGVVERSFDAGKTWQKISVPEGSVFRALAAIGAHVWAGGAKGLLFHSVDSGETWVSVRPSVAGRTLAEDITRIDFSDLMNGTVTTADGTVWKTSDGGQSWRWQ